ncbi:Protein diaphanous-like protein 3 [Camelus dromedarius]|uniref:Protein diaphanous-like protein 3 n=1 Tax=Camelus dromedarius TaxID=9838 RepID=A0A5N4D8G8_CAMDR|nr:Protein diaphanous-like protein 3 [Camelus dromedarius]
MDPDFSYRKRLDLDLSQFVDICIDQAKLEEFEEKASELHKKFEKEFTDHQETQARLQKKEAEINELQAELQAFKSQVKYHLPGVNLGIESSPGEQRKINAQAIYFSEPSAYGYLAVKDNLSS